MKESGEREALRCLVRFESALVSAFAACGGVTDAQIRQVVAEAEAATALMGDHSPFRSRPSALAVVAQRVASLVRLRAVNGADVVRAMLAVEASWSLDPDKRLLAIDAEELEPFTLRVMELDGEIQKATP